MKAFKPFLLLQVRPEDEAANNEYEAFCTFGNLDMSEVHRIRLDRESWPEINLDQYSGVLLGGGPYNISDTVGVKTSVQLEFEQKLNTLMSDIVTRDFPYLGDCYGIGTLSTCLGGVVSKERYSETVGTIDVQLTEEGMQDKLLVGLPETFRALGGHKEACQDVPEGAVLLASSEQCPVQMIRVKQNVYATQFHVELDVPSLMLRIDIYKHAGYFPPEDAETLKDKVKNAHITVPMAILERFVETYKKPLDVPQVAVDIAAE